MSAKFYICRTLRQSGWYDSRRRCSHDVLRSENGRLYEPNTVEASGEKHLPAVTVEDGAIHVNVGSVDHPMLPEHFIEWVYVQTENGGQRKVLKPGDEPHVTFSLGDDKAVAVYAYCNLHGLWKTEI